MALSTDDLQAIRGLLTEGLKPIHTKLNTMDRRMDSMEEKLETIEEDVHINRENLNTLLKWAEKAEKVIGVGNLY